MRSTSATHDDEQPPAGLQEAEGIVGEADPQRSGRAERSGEEQRQEGPQPAGSRQAGAETYVEEDAVHATSVQGCATVQVLADL